MLTRERSLWSVAGAASLAAGVTAIVIALLVRTGGRCVAGRVDVWWDIAFVALALIPAIVVTVLARVQRRPAEEIMLPVALALCVSVVVVFGCLLVALSGHGCLR